MKTKYVFVDLDGTILDYNTHSVPKSTVEAMKLARENGHEIVLTTGRPPALFDGIDKELGFHSFIAANGRLVVFHDEIIFESPIPESAIDQIKELAQLEKFDIAYESMDAFVLESKYEDIYIKFCDHFNLKYPVLEANYYKGKSIYQINLFYEKEDFKRFEQMIPNLSFVFSCQYGIDVNTLGGFKEVGIKEFMKVLHLTQEDIITIGDGFNDISMLQFADVSVAMGNAHMDVQKEAKFVTDRIEDDGLYKAFKMLKLI